MASITKLTPDLRQVRASDLQALAHCSPGQRAGLAAQLLLGERALSDLRIEHVARLTGANPVYIRAALRASPRERAELAAGAAGALSIPGIKRLVDWRERMKAKAIAAKLEL